MTETKPFIPGFESEAKARIAGQRFFARANGEPGVFGRDFHVVQNEHGRFHFREGKAPKAA